MKKDTKKHGKVSTKKKKDDEIFQNLCSSLNISMLVIQISNLHSQESEKGKVFLGP
jgi:hypothetical protein